MENIEDLNQQKEEEGIVSIIKKKQLPSQFSSNIDMEYPARISSQLFTYNEYRWKMELRPFRILMMFSQALAMEKQPYPSLFPEYSFSLNKVFTYMGLDNNNKRYNLIIQDIKKLMGTVIEKKELTKRGKIKWVGKTLISWCDIDAEQGTLNIQINEKSRQYLVGMQRWAELQPQIYLQLSTWNQNWFYAYFKKEMFQARSSKSTIKIVVLIQTLKESLFLDEVKTYNPELYKNANEKFFTKILGICKPKNWKYNTEDESKNTPWDYVTESGKKTGTLYAITTLTDINVGAYAIKNGKSYDRICFILSPKQSYIIDRLKKSASQNESSSTPAKQRKTKKITSDMLMNDLFAQPPVLDSYDNPINDENLPKPDFIILPAESIDQFLADYKRGNPDAEEITKEAIAKKMGYEILEDGRFIKYYTKK